MTIMGILAALSLTAFSGAGGAPLDTGVVRVMNSLTLARSEAIARNTPVQLRIVVEDSDASTAGRVFSLFERRTDGSGTYKQLTGWERLPDTVSLLQNDTGLVPTTGKPTGTNLLADLSPSNTNFFDDMPFQNRQVDALAIEFTPTGAVRMPASSTASHSVIYLASTVPSSPSLPSGGAVTLGARTAEVKNKNNWRQIRVSNFTGQVRVNAPGAY